MSIQTTLFLKGIILGFSIAAPVGPIGVLCIRKALQFGRVSAWFSGLGAAGADACYAAIAAFGLALISNTLLAGQFWLRMIGGGFLLYLGAKTFFAKPHQIKEKLSQRMLLKDFVSTFVLTITNPMTILSFLAVFAGIGLHSIQGSYLEALLLVLGVFLGSCAWWVLLSESVRLFQSKISHTSILWINRIAGTIIALFGVAAFFSLFLYRK